MTARRLDPWFGPVARSTQAVAMLLLATLALPAGAGGDEAIPLTNRPANFSGAAGAYRLEMRATPIAVQVEEPIVLTVKILSLLPGSRPHPPVRDKLHLFGSELERDFFVEPVPEEDRYLARENAWEFNWRLAARRPGSLQIPAADFVYYQTTGPQGFKVADGGQAITIQVTARKAALLTAPREARARFEELAPADALVGVSWPLWLVWVLLILPPGFCLLAHGAWRRALAGPGERLRRRRGQALKAALVDLPGAGPAEIRRMVLESIDLRIPLKPGENTAHDVERALVRAGSPPETAQAARGLLLECDRALYAPVRSSQVDFLAAHAARFIQRLEEERWMQR